MAFRYRTKAFVLAKKYQGEADQFLTFYTENFGKIEVLGKAIRKINSKLKTATNFFSLLEIEFIQGKSYKTLTDAALIKNFRKKDLKILKAAYQIVEIADNLIKGEEEDRKVWGLFEETFEKLSDCSSFVIPCILIYYYFLWNLLLVLGYQINLYCCAVCQKKLFSEDLYFKPEKGIVCFDCFRKNKKGNKISSDVVKVLRLFLNKNWSVLSKLKVSDNFKNLLQSVSEDYLEGLNIR